MNSLAELLTSMPDDVRHRALSELSAADLVGLEHCWPVWARPDQLPPPPPWRVWALCGGRGSGKTRAAAERVRSEVVKRPAPVYRPCGGNCGRSAS